MLLKVILFLLALYLIIGILKKIFEFKNIINTVKPKVKKKSYKKITYSFDAEDIPFEEIDKK